MSGLSPELQLTMACLRRGLQQPVAPTVNPDADWDQWVADTFRYGLVPLVWAGLTAQSVGNPEAAQTALRTGAARSALTHKVWFEPALRQVLADLAEAGMQPIVLKGSALAYLAYPRPYHRTLVDIDLLFQIDRIDAAARCLLDRGYQPLDYDTPRGHHHIPPFATPDGRFSIELHHHVLPEANPYAIDLDTLTARTELRSLAGVEARVLAAEDTLWHVCVHLAYGHRYEWYPLRSLTDILALTSYTAHAMDWDLLLDTVRRTRTAGAIYWPLRLSQHWLGASIPDVVLRQLAPPTATRRLIERVIESPYILDGHAPAERGASVLYNAVLELSLYGGCSARAQLGAAVATLFPPRDAISHLPADITESQLRYATHWWNPPRLVRGVVALGRLVAHRPLPRSVESTRSNTSIGAPPQPSVMPVPSGARAEPRVTADT
jgi:hypothetical protein